MRVKRGVKARRRRNKIFQLAKGFRGRSGNTIRMATNRVEKALTKMFIGRKQRKRQFRQLWIARINASVREHGMSYSVFMHALTKAGVTMNRKTLSELGIRDPKAFAAVVEIAKKHV